MPRVVVGWHITVVEGEIVELCAVSCLIPGSSSGPLRLLSYIPRERELEPLFVEAHKIFNDALVAEPPEDKTPPSDIGRTLILLRDSHVPWIRALNELSDCLGVKRPSSEQEVPDA